MFYLYIHMNYTHYRFRSGFLQVLDKYTNLGVYIVHHSFTLAELFTLSGLQFTSQTIKSGLMVQTNSSVLYFASFFFQANLYQIYIYIYRLQKNRLASLMEYLVRMNHLVQLLQSSHLCTVSW
jgi:hypothetical protein